MKLKLNICSVAVYLKHMTCQTLNKMNFIIVVLSLMTTLSPVLSETCIQDGPCSCHVKGGKVDLKRLSTPNPRFRNVRSPNQSNFTYNPCVGIANGCSPADADGTVAVCQWDVGGKFNDGLANTATFIGEPGTSGFAIIYYHLDASNLNRTSTVRLICTEDEAEFKVIGEVKTVTYEFELRSKYCCKVQVGLSTGSVLLIIFFVLLLVYIVGGVLFLHFARGAQGVEMIPNREFWKELPFLIFDGCKFAIKGCSSLCKRDASYSQI